MLLPSPSPAEEKAHNVRRVAAYIDGFNLYYGIRGRRWRRFYWLNLWDLATCFIPDGYELSRVRYFTAMVIPPPHDPLKRKRQEAYIDALRTLPRLDVCLGSYLRKTRTCRQCHGRYEDFEEKSTDVWIGAQMIADAYEDRFDRAILVSGDGDLMRPLKMIRERFPQKDIVVVFPPDRFNKKLRDSAHACLSITQTELRRSLFPETVFNAQGFPIKRPSSWA